MSGRRCPQCSSTKIHVVESSPSHNNETRRLRRRCLHCDHAWTIYEIDRETLEHYRDIMQKYEHIKDFVTRDKDKIVCVNCRQWEKDSCLLSIPEAGGLFADECPYYYRA